MLFLFVMHDTPGVELYPSGSCSAGGPGVGVDRAGKAVVRVCGCGRNGVSVSRSEIFLVMGGARLGVPRSCEIAFAD